MRSVTVGGCELQPFHESFAHCNSMQRPGWLWSPSQPVFNPNYATQNTMFMWLPLAITTKGQQDWHHPLIGGNT